MDDSIDETLQPSILRYEGNVAKHALGQQGPPDKLLLFDVLSRSQ